MTYSHVQHWLGERMALDAPLLTGAGFESLVRERMRELGCADEGAYLSELEKSAEEGERLAAGVAVPETWFFRYPSSFGLLVEFLSGLERKGAAALRMLSIGCASGEEPYSMAMAALHAGWTGDRVEIDAIDRSGDSIARARAAEYGSFSLRHEIPPWAIGMLGHDGTRITVDERVRRCVRFWRADSLEPDAIGSGAIGAGGGYDAVFCRNVMIYLNPAARGRLLEAIAGRVRNGGLLFVGHAEQMLASGPLFHRVDRPHAFALERRDAAAGEARAVFATKAVRPAASATPVIALRARMNEGAVAAVGGEAESLADARALADAGQTCASEALIRSIMARKGPSAEAFELLGTLRQAAKDASGARALFEQALYLEPARPTSLLQLALIYEQLGEHAKAERMWERVKRGQAEGSWRMHAGGAP